MVWNHTASRFQVVLEPGAYHVITNQEPAGFFKTTETYDLTSGDVITTLPLHTTYVSPIPIDPPVASLITFSPPDGLGQVTISGAPGAALPLANLMIINLKSWHSAHVTSAADGSFSATLFAPRGSDISIRHGPAHWR